MKYSFKNPYISGPMTGIENFNYAAFHAAEYALIATGYNVVNPARMDEQEGIVGMNYQDLLKRDLAVILSDCDAIVFLPGWRNSRGATLEGYVAQQAGLDLFEIDMDASDEDSEAIHWDSLSHNPDTPGYADSGGFYKLTPVENVSVAYAAQGIVLGARRFTYGHPLDNFLKIAALWNATIGHKMTEPLDVRDVAVLMMQVKVAREYNSPKEDNRVDLVGYALALDEAMKEAEARGGSLDAFLADNAALLREHSVMGADK